MTPRPAAIPTIIRLCLIKEEERDDRCDDDEDDEPDDNLLDQLHSVSINCCTGKATTILPHCRPLPAIKRLRPPLTQRGERGAKYRELKEASTISSGWLRRPSRR